jgi:hypothetical protein
MGRPPIGKHAMSGAERQRRYLEKLLGGKSTVSSVTKQTKADEAKDREIAALRARIAKLEAENAALKAQLARERAEKAQPSVTNAAETAKQPADTAEQEAELKPSAPLCGYPSNHPSRQSSVR